MTFNIGTQTAGVINNAGRDQRITGGQQGTLVTQEAALHAVLDLRRALTDASLDEGTAASARARVNEIRADLEAPQPDQSRVARSLEQLTHILTAAGPLATAGAALVHPLQTLASWLGILGEPILRLLPTLR